ncbi:MAG TPA: efflux RND transporter periplasmic adaptor subunit [Polyangiales bacterium]|nr:efflux RND transporter periplasmic adaptor subunit [Polyangiales bacterium]
MSEVQGALPQTRSLRGGWYVLLALLLAGLGLATRQWLTSKPEDPPFVTVTRGDIAARTLASGRIVPREEVFVRSLVAGVLAELHVQAGDQVKKGQQLALVRVVADPVVLSEAHGRVKLAEEKLARAQRELDRLARIQDGVGLSGQELAKAEDALREARTELDSARERELFVKQGANREPGTRSTRIVAPVDGTVLAVPVAVGDVIGDTNSYRDGTTLAVVADMSQLLFKGQLEEAHVGKLKLGMPANVRVGALEGATTPGTLRWIAPRATIESSSGGASASPTAGSNAQQLTPLGANSAGITRFELWVALEKPPAEARAGYSATAELTLAERKDAVLVEERALRFSGSEIMANVIGPDGSTREKKLEVGISDGLRIEVKSGLAPGERVALPQP